MNVGILIPQAPPPPVNGGGCGSRPIVWIKKHFSRYQNITLDSLYVVSFINACIFPFSIIMSPLIANDGNWRMAKSSANVILGGTLPLSVIACISSHFARTRQISSTATLNRALAALSLQMSVNTAFGVVLINSPCFTTFLHDKFDECKDMVMTGLYITITAIALNVIGMIYAGCFVPSIKSRV